MPRERRQEKRITVYRAEVPGSAELWEVEYEAVADALHFACRDLREGRRRPLEIVEGGEVVYDAESLPGACRELEEQRAADREGA
jgi:hypothetical protein